MRISTFHYFVFLGAASMIACAPDCNVASFKIAECVAKDQAAQAVQERERVDCETGELPVYYQCWEEVDTTSCNDATKICAPYAQE